MGKKRGMESLSRRRPKIDVFEAEEEAETVDPIAAAIAAKNARKLAETAAVKRAAAAAAAKAAPAAMKTWFKGDPPTGTANGDQSASAGEQPDLTLTPGASCDNVQMQEQRRSQPHTEAAA